METVTKRVVKTRRARVTPEVRYLDGGVGQVKVMVMHDAVYSGPTVAQHEHEERFPIVDNPEKAAAAIRKCNELCGGVWEAETAYVLLMTCRRRVMGWVQVATGTVDTLLITPPSVFRAAIAAGAHAVIIGHTHPSGDPNPSEADIRVTRELIRADTLLKVPVLDHIIVGNPALAVPGMRGYTSLNELGYFSF